MALAITVAVGLVLYNTVTNLRWPGDRWYVPRNVVVGALLVVLARAAGLSWSDLGLGPDAFWEGWRWARIPVVAIAIAVAIGLALASRVGWISGLFSDERANLDDHELVWHAFVRIPIGTAAFEEIAFRGVLLGLFLEPTGTATAVVIASVAFGLWHVGPTLAAHDVNRAATSRLRSVLLAVVVTTIAGVLFALLRLASSVVAPILVHTATNVFGLLGSAVHQRTEPH